MDEKLNQLNIDLNLLDEEFPEFKIYLKKWVTWDFILGQALTQTSNCSVGVYDRVVEYLETYNTILKKKMSEKSDKLFYLISALEKGSDTTINGIRNTSIEMRDIVDDFKDVERKLKQDFEDSTHR